MSILTHNPDMATAKKIQSADPEQVIKKINAYLPDFDDGFFRKAYLFAEKAHGGQMRKDGKTPYIVHPLSVAGILADMHADQDVLIAALLHDVPEDTKHSLVEIKRLFGEKIAFLVSGITKLSKVHYRNNMPEREIKSLKKLFLHSSKDLRVIIIKLADRLHNMRTLGYVNPEKRLRIARETLEIYVPIANLLGIFRIKEELEDLCFQYLFPNEFLRITTKLTEMGKNYKNNARMFVKTLTAALEKNGVKAKVYDFRKGLYRAYKKITAQGKTIDGIKDRIAVKVITPDEHSCYQTLGILHGLFTPKPDRFKDFIAHPKINGYRALHTVVFGFNGVITEVQIQSNEMHLENEFGIVSNFFRKNGKLSDLWAGDKRSVWVDQIIEMDKSKKPAANFIENLKVDIFQDRIFVFTPKGKTIDLPKGATVVDFAYAIHSDVGNHAARAVINGRSNPVMTSLKTGDVVQVITGKDTFPSLSWLSFTKTNLAKNKILAQMKKVSRKQKIEVGRDLLQKEFDIAGLGLIENLNFRNLKKALKEKFGEIFERPEDIFVRLGEGGLRATNVVKAIKKEPREMLKSQIDTKLRINVKIKATNKMGLLKEIADILYKYVLDISNIKATTSADGKEAIFNIQIVVDDIEKISQIFYELEELESVHAVYRMSYRDLYWFYSFAVTTLALWAIHPLLLGGVLRRERLPENDFFADLAIFGGLFMLGFMLFYLNRSVRKYFPLMRKKSMLMITSLVVVTLAVTIVCVELIYFNVNFGWLMGLIFAVLMYSYLAISFRGFRKKI